MSLKILLRFLRAGRQELVNGMEDGPEKSRTLEDIAPCIARVKAGVRSAVYAALDPEDQNGDAAEDFSMSEELEEGDIPEKRPQKSLKERVHALNFTLRVFSLATPYNDSHFNTAEDMLSEMSASDLAIFIRRLRSNLGGESGPKAKEIYPKSVPRRDHSERDERRLREW